MGYYISISGIVTFANAENVRIVARQVPEDRLLIETDAPWLALFLTEAKKTNRLLLRRRSLLHNSGMRVLKN